MFRSEISVLGKKGQNLLYVRPTVPVDIEDKLSRSLQSEIQYKYFIEEFSVATQKLSMEK